MNNTQSLNSETQEALSNASAKRDVKDKSTGRFQVPVLATKGMLSALTWHPREPNTIVVLHPDHESSLLLALCLRKTDEPGVLLRKSMLRDQHEIASKALDRIRMFYAPKRPLIAKGQRLQREEILNSCPRIMVLGTRPSEDAFNISSDANQISRVTSQSEAGVCREALIQLDTALPGNVFWRHAHFIQLGEEEIRVKYNIPIIISLKVPSKVLVGAPLSCTHIETLFVEKEKLHYEWCIREPQTQKCQAHNLESDSEKYTSHLHVLSTEPFFIPTKDLLGKCMLLRVGLSKKGPWSELEVSTVQESPPPMLRWDQTLQYIEAPNFRVVTYNILHDDFCTSKLSKHRIYPFASDSVLDIENRSPRILQELMMYHSDLICLQECGQRLFKDYLEPVMSACGYGAHYVNKTGNAQEGCVILYRKQRFEMVVSETCALNWDTLISDHPELLSEIEPYNELKEGLQKITSVGLLLILKEITTGRELVLGTTHLFYHADACHIRILQTFILLHRLHRLSMSAVNTQDARSIGASRPRPVVLCGDFNFTHSTGAYRFITTGQVESTHHSWEKGKVFWWGRDQQRDYGEKELALSNCDSQDITLSNNQDSVQCDSVNVETTEWKDGKSRVEYTSMNSPNQSPNRFFSNDLHSPLALVDAYGETDPSMPWTNYTLTFREVIDYIFFSLDSIDVLRTVPIPPESELSENHALPNVKYPSDHLALIADLVFKR